jgi:peroxiredoxin
MKMRGGEKRRAFQAAVDALTLSPCMNLQWNLAAACVVMLALTGCAPKVEPPPRTVSPSPLGAFTLPDLQGTPVSSASFHGKITILHFCASWSPSSAREISQLVRIQSRYGKKGVQVIGIALEEDDGSDMRAFAKRTSLNYPMLIADDSFHRQLGGIDAIPSTFMIDPDGRIMNKHTGLISPEFMEAEIALMRQEAKEAAKLAGK